MVFLQKPEQAIADMVYRAYEVEAGDTRRSHLGASQIGKVCSRALWYDFRWAFKRAIPGRILRLFQSGFSQEARLERDLKYGAKMNLETRDPKTGKQFQFGAFNDHFGGSCDGQCTDVPGSEKTMHIVEFKTSNDRNFQKIKKEGVRSAKPEHYGQMQVYMQAFGMMRALYVVVNKNDEEIYVERVKYNEEVADALFKRAEEIILAIEPPAKINEDPTWYECRYCDVAEGCHRGAPPERNCRTCKHVVVQTDPERPSWWCEYHYAPLSDKRQMMGCGFHCYIPALVPGKILEEYETAIVYEINGERWQDGVQL